MSGKLAREIKQAKPFESLEQEAFLNVLKTAAILEEADSGGLKKKRLSPTQYNALRILRGAGPKGLACQDIAERMIKRDPDITRLLDRLVGQGLVVRDRSKEDRRVVITRISENGLKLLASLDPIGRQVSKRALGHLGKKRLELLIELLEEAREGS